MTEEHRIIATLSELEERRMSEIDATYHPMHLLLPNPKIDFENLAAVRQRADAWMIEHPTDPPSPPIRSYLIDGAPPKRRGRRPRLVTATTMPIPDSPETK